MRFKPNNKKIDKIYRFQSRISIIFCKIKIQTLDKLNLKCKSKNILKNIIYLK